MRLALRRENSDANELRGFREPGPGRGSVSRGDAQPSGDVACLASVGCGGLPVVRVVRGLNRFGPGHKWGRGFLTAKYAKYANRAFKHGWTPMAENSQGRFATKKHKNHKNRNPISCALCASLRLKSSLLTQAWRGGKILTAKYAKYAKRECCLSVVRVVRVVRG